MPLTDVAWGITSPVRTAQRWRRRGTVENGARSLNRAPTTSIAWQRNGNISSQSNSFELIEADS